MARNALGEIWVLVEAGPILLESCTEYGAITVSPCQCWQLINNEIPQRVALGVPNAPSNRELPHLGGPFEASGM